MHSLEACRQSCSSLRHLQLQGWLVLVLPFKGQSSPVSLLLLLLVIISQPEEGFVFQLMGTHKPCKHGVSRREGNATRSTNLFADVTGVIFTMNFVLY